MARDRFRDGLRVGAWGASAVLGTLYIGLAPSSDYRARIVFLVGVSPLGFGLFLLAVLVAVASLAMAYSRRDFSWAAIRGLVVAALVGATGIASGIVGWLTPDVPESPLRWLGVLIVLVVVGVGLSRERVS